MPKAAPPGPGPQKSELMIVIMSIPNLPDSIGVTYNDDPGDDQVKKDLKEVARVLGSEAGPIDITRRAGYPSGETNISGLADWHTGQVALDPLIQAYRRYGHFHVVYMFGGSFPLKAAEQFAQGPIRVEPHVQDTGNAAPGNAVQRGLTVDYEIWVDQKNGPPKNIPSVGARPGLDVVRMGLVVALLGVALLIVILMVKVVRARRQAEGERPDWES